MNNKILVTTGLILITVSIIMIPMKLNETETWYGYQGRLLLTTTEYDTFKQSLLENSKDNVLERIKTLDQKGDTVYIEFYIPSNLITESFPYGERITMIHDGSPYDWLKPVLLILGIIIFIIGTSLKDNKDE